MFLLIASEIFPESTVVPSFLAREVDMKVSNSRTTLVNESNRYGETTAVV